MLKQTRVVKDDLGSAKGASGTWPDRFARGLGRTIDPCVCSSVPTYSQCDIDALHTCIPWGYESLSAGSVLQERLCYYDH
jgi:hypothetical protein